MSAWISVKERLPDHGVDVLTGDLDKTTLCIGYRSRRSGLENSFYSTETGDYLNVSHWQPLPEPPEES